MKDFSIGIGQYYPADTVIHSLDPRVKIIAGIVFMAAAFSIVAPVGIAMFAILCVVSVQISKIPWRMILRGTKGLSLIIFMTLLVHLFFTDGNVVFSIGAVKATSEGLFSGVTMSIRLIIVVWLTSLLTLTTPPAQLTDGFSILMSPLRRLRVPVHELSLMMTIALRFVPTLAAEADRTIKAQQARAASFNAKNPVKRAASYIPIIIPLFVASLRRADELALAMEARCYHGGTGRTRLNPLKMRISDWLALAIVFTILSLVVFFWRGN